MAFEGHQHMQLDFVSFHERREMTINFQHTIWSHFKSSDQDDTISDLAENMNHPNPLIESSIIESSRLGSSLNAVPAIDMGFADTA